MQVEQITEPLTEHGEGPVWDVASGRLHWVDMLRGDVLTLDGSVDSPDISRQHLSDVVAAVRPRADGGLVLAEHLALPVPPSPIPSSRPLQPLVSADTIGGAPVRSANDLKSMERTMIEKALQDARFNKSKAAAILGLTRAQLYGRMRRYGLD